MRLRLGTRGSPLALWQAHHVAERLRAAWPGLAVDLSILRTEGDQTADEPFTRLAGTGVFVREIESALLAGTIDLAVHSLKDLPTETPEGLSNAVTLPRHDPRDALVSSSATRIEDLARDATVATGSPRRTSQLLHVRPDLRFQSVRGNVDTRVRKLAAGAFDALILAVSGIERLGLTHAPYTPIPFSVCLPAPGQGALAVQIRADDVATFAFVSPLNDAETECCVAAERSFLRALGAGCLAPAGAFAKIAIDKISLTAMVGSLDGKTILRDRIEGAARDADELGASLARRILAAGGESILREAREAIGPDGP